MVGPEIPVRVLGYRFRVFGSDLFSNHYNVIRVYYKVTGITKCNRKLLQSVTGITKYKKLLQSVTSLQSAT